MVTLALRRSRFSSCRALHLSLNVSSSILRTLFSCCSEARRFVSSSKRNCEMTMLGFPEFEAEDDIGVAELLPAPSVSLSLALSAMAVRQCGAEEGKRTAAAACEQRRQQSGTTVWPCSHSATSRMSPVPPNASLTNETETFNTSLSATYMHGLCWRIFRFHSGLRLEKKKNLYLSSEDGYDEHSWSMEGNTNIYQKAILTYPSVSQGQKAFCG